MGMVDIERRKPKESTADEIELRPDGWERFEQAVDAAIKSGPKHREPVKHKPVEKPE
jgi:hypothetical protein